MTTTPMNNAKEDKNFPAFDNSPKNAQIPMHKRNGSKWSRSAISNEVGVLSVNAISNQTDPKQIQKSVDLGAEKPEQKNASFKVQVPSFNNDKEETKSFVQAQMEAHAKLESKILLQELKIMTLQDREEKALEQLEEANELQQNLKEENEKLL